MRQRRVGVVLAALIVGCLVLAGCGTPAGGAGAATSAPAPIGAVAGQRVGVILPDRTTSARWEEADRPALRRAFDAAGVEYTIENADGDPERFLSLADSMIAGGIGVLMITSLDSDSGAEVIRRAAAAGVPVIDYDRLTLGGGAKYYVSFDNVAVGRTMGEALVTAMHRTGKETGRVLELNGAPTDNNATLFRQGYDEVVKGAGFQVVDSRPVPNWDDKKAADIFTEMYAKADGRVDGVIAANDGLAGAVIGVLDRAGAAGKIPVTGQDATDAGLRRVLAGTQTVTVYKAVEREAAAAAKLAIAMIRGDNAAADAQASGSVEHVASGTYVRAVLLQPKAIDAASVKDVVADGYTTADRLCVDPDLRAACERYGVG